MHWIEQLWGVDPDNGSGTLEMAILLATLVIASASARVAKRRLRRKSQRGRR